MITGRCLCDQITLEITGESFGSGACYCVDCQKTAGGGPAYAVVFQKSDVHFTSGTPKIHWSLSETGNSIGRGFCGDCGTPIFGLNNIKPDYMPVMVGALDDKSIFKLNALSWVSKAQHWHFLDPNVEAFDKNIPE